MRSAPAGAARQPRDPHRGRLLLAEALEFALRVLKIKLSSLQAAFYLDNTEAVTGYLEAVPEALGFVSCRALARELVSGRLGMVPIDGLHLPRHFEAVWVQGEPLAGRLGGGWPARVVAAETRLTFAQTSFLLNPLQQTYP